VLLLIYINAFWNKEINFLLRALPRDIMLKSSYILKPSLFPADAFEREKKMKGSSRKRKISLVNGVNPGWNDLFENLKANEIDDLIRIRKTL